VLGVPTTICLSGTSNLACGKTGGTCGICIPPFQQCTVGECK
jgi:hypothetical protein